MDFWLDSTYRRARLEKLKLKAQTVAGGGPRLQTKWTFGSIPSHRGRRVSGAQDGAVATVGVDSVPEGGTSAAPWAAPFQQRLERRPRGRRHMGAAQGGQNHRPLFMP